MALPPKPTLEMSEELNQLLQNAVSRIAELRIASNLVPSTDFFNYAFVRKEAILSWRFLRFDFLKNYQAIQSLHQAKS